jgi:hypothetical protein
MQTPVWHVFHTNKIHYPLEPGYVRTPSKSKISSKGARTVDFASRFVIIIESVNLKPRDCLKYESQCKINGSRTLQINF